MLVQMLLVLLLRARAAVGSPPSARAVASGGVAETDAAAAVDELVRLYHVEPHMAATAIAQQYLDLPSSGQHQLNSPRAKPTTTTAAATTTVSPRRALQEHPLSARIWDLDVLRDNPCATDEVPTPAEKIVAVGSDAALAAALLADADPHHCSDALATNTGAPQACTYDCDALAQYYGLASSSEPTCYIRGAASWPLELTDQIRSTQDWFYFLPEQTNPAETMTFDVGNGRSCVNVTVETLLFADGNDEAGGGGTEVEVRCMLEGTHNITHEYTDRHTIQASSDEIEVGYSSSNIVHSGPGGTTEIIVGTCDEAVIRVQTMQATQTVQWTLDDPNDAGDSHMGPWEFETPAGQGTLEFRVCLFANTFSLRKSTDEWSGTVSVVQIKPDYSIELPTEGSVIIQGSLNDQGVPNLLDARLTSGSVEDPSFLSMVIRFVRFSGLNAPEDRDAAKRPYSHNAFPTYPYKSIGGAVSYHGGWGATLVFERCVFDHLRASSGAGIFIDHLMGMWAKESVLRSEEQRRISITIDGCLAWQTRASWVGALVRMNNIQPLALTVRDSQFVDNTAVVCNTFGAALYPNVFEAPYVAEGEVSHGGMDGTSTITYDRLEMTNPNYMSGQNVLHQFNFLAFSGFQGTHPGTSWNFEVNEVYMYDIVAVFAAGYALYSDGDTGMPGHAGQWNFNFRNSHIEEVHGASTSSMYSGNAAYHVGTTVEYEHMRFDNSGSSLDTFQEGIGEGVLLLMMNQVARLSHSSFTNLVSAEGGAIMLKGAPTAMHEIVSCTFRNNLAWNNGGAIVYKQGTGLHVASSVFSSNQVALEQRSVLVDVTIRVFTGSSGVLLNTDGISASFAEEHLAIWKMDGDIPDPLTGQVAGNETVYGNGTEVEDFMLQQRTYSTVLRLAPGPHTLWHGLIAGTPGNFNGWAGNGWIDVVDILPKVYPVVFDNRAAPDANNVVRSPGCYNGNSGSDAPNLCPVGEAFWSYTDFNVPYGYGGAIASFGQGTLTISDSLFEANQAGRGTVLSAIAAEQLIVRNSSVQGDDAFAIYLENSRPQLTCQEAGCDLGMRCDFAQLSLVCTQCQRNEIGDGRTCVACPPGSAPNSGQTECEPCADGYKSSLGICEPCQAGKVSSTDRVTCMDCLPGTATGLSGIACEDCTEQTTSAGQQVECTACTPGKQPNSDHTACVECPSGRAGTDGICWQCPPGTQPDESHSSCQRCFLTGEVSSDGSTCAACQDGTQPNAGVTECIPCPLGSAGRAGVCLPCGAGTQPREDRMDCEECDPGKFSTGSIEHSVCTECPPGKTTNDDQTGCDPCGPMAASVDGVCVECSGRKVPSPDRSACICKPGTYSQDQIGLIQCHGDLRDDDLDDECIECASCLDCAELGIVQVASGWAIYGIPGNLFQCPLNEACPAQTVVNVSSTIDSNCAVGYTGPVCGDCQEGYNHLKVGEPCDSCVGNVVNIPLLLGLVFGILVMGAVVISGMAAALRDHGVITDLRITVGFYQLLAQMSNVLNIELPEPIPGLVAFIKLFFLDLRQIVRADCWDAGGLYLKLIINVFIVPLLFFFGCVVVYLQQRKTAEVIIAAGGADASALATVRAKFKQNIFVGIFRFPQCRSLGEDSFHEEDYSVDCSSSTFMVVGFATLVLIGCIPIGVPFGFLWAMKKKSVGLGGINTTALGGAKLNEPEADDDDDDYSFLIKDYRPEYWFYEIVTYMRKLLLAGLSVVMARGTMAQIYFVAAVESFFLCYHFRTYPFVTYKHNLMDGLGHLCLILTYVCCIVLRKADENLWSDEVITKRGYGYFICFLYIFVLPSPTVYYYFKDAKTLNAMDADKQAESEFGNPLHPLTADPDYSVEDSTASTALPRARIAKLKRDWSAAKAQTDSLRTKVRQQAAEIERLKLTGNQGAHLPAEERLAMEQQAIEQRLSEQAAAAAEVERQHKQSIGADGNFNVRRPSQVTAMKEMVEGGMLSDEILQSAKQSLESHVHDGILLQQKDIDKRRQREIDEDLRDLEKLSKIAHDGRASMREFLDKNRLLRHEGAFLEVCGRDMSVDDLEFLGDEEMTSIKANMTPVEGKRLDKALQKMQAE